ncbi:MAG: hypothetical protein WCA78_04185 [Rhizomicrobium sp.]
MAQFVTPASFLPRLYISSDFFELFQTSLQKLYPIASPVLCKECPAFAFACQRNRLAGNFINKGKPAGKDRAPDAEPLGMAGVKRDLPRFAPGLDDVDYDIATRLEAARFVVGPCRGQLLRSL